MAITGHPRLWLTEADLPRLRSWADASNPVYETGLKPLAEYAVQMAANDPVHVPADDNGSSGYTPYPTEMYAHLFAFMALISSDASTRDSYATRARSLLMHVISGAEAGAAEGQKFRSPKFAIADRSRWHGQAFGLTVDWIYPYLTPQDKGKIRTVFLRWCDENLHAGTTDHNHPEPIGTVNDPLLLHLDQPWRKPLRYSANNYYLAHARNIGLMALAFDPADDPGGTLRDYIGNVTGAWLYVTDHVLRNDLSGGLSPEGFYYGPSALGRLVHLLLAFHTSGEADPAKWGQQAVLASNPFWSDSLVAYLHSLSPRPIEHPELGQVYPGAAFGDASTYTLRDPIELFGPLGLYYAATGDLDRLATARWIQLHTAPGGESALVHRVSRLREAFHQAILYYMLFDPAAPAPADPRAQFATTFLGTGLNRLLARTGWDDDASWLTYKNSWNRVDHQQSDAGMVELWRKGEWLTKGWTGYPGTSVTITCSDYHNTLAIENDDPDTDLGSIRDTCYRRGSQWLFVAQGDPQLAAHSTGDNWLYVTGDMTNLYNYEEEWKKPAADVLHASRSVVWLKPDHVIIYDRASTKTAGRFKRFWLNVPGVPAAPNTVNGAPVTSIASASAAQMLHVTSMMPADAIISHDDGKADLASGESAADEPMKGRLRVEAAGGPADVRFLHVLQGADTEVPASVVTKVESASGTPFAGVEVQGMLVFFRRDLDGELAATSFPIPDTAKRILITGLMPGAGYVVTETASAITVSPDGPTVADEGGVLIIEKASAPVPPSGPVDKALEPLAQAQLALETLQGEITASGTKAREEITQNQRALAEIGAKQSDVASQLGSLQKLLSDLSANSQTVARLRASVARTLSSAEEAHRHVLAEIDKAMPSQRRTAIEEAIAGVERKIADLEKKVQELRAGVATAQSDVDEFRKRVAEGALRNSLTRFLQLPTALQTAQRQIAKLVSTSEAAVSGKRPGEALYLAGELKRAMETLENLQEPASEVRDLEELVDRWKETQTAKGELAEKVKNLDSLTRELAAVERELGLRRQQRERDVRAAIADAEHVKV